MHAYLSVKYYNDYVIAATQHQGQMLILPSVFTKSLIRIIKHFILDWIYVHFEN